MSWIPDPSDPTVPYSQQRILLLALIEGGLTAQGLVGSPRMLLNVYAQEVWDLSQQCAGETPPFWLGTTEHVAEENIIETPVPRSGEIPDDSVDQAH